MKNKFLMALRFTLKTIIFCGIALIYAKTKTSDGLKALAIIYLVGGCFFCLGYAFIDECIKDFRNNLNRKRNKKKIKYKKRIGAYYKQREV